MEAASLTAPAGLIAAKGGGRLLRLRSDDQLVALFRMGNEDAFRVIHDRYRARLFAYTRQMLSGSASDAEDALQDVFLRAYGALRADDRPVTLRAWLYRVAHNRCVDHMRRPANQPTGELFENVTSLHDPLADIQRRDDLRRLVADVQALPEQQRSALLMREMEGLSYAELADALGVTVPSVKSLLVRARIGLTEAREARDTACVEIRSDLLAAHDKGVRVNARSRRHLKECDGCAEYRGRLRGVRAGLAQLGPSPTGWGLVAKLLGLGGAGGGAAAAGGGGAATAGSALVAGGTAKVAVLVCCAAVVGGGAVEAKHSLTHTPKASAATPRRVVPAAAAPRAVLPAAVVAHQQAPAARARHAAAAAKAKASAKAEKARAQAALEARTKAATHLRAAPLADDGPPSMGPSADEDVQQASAAGGALAPSEDAPDPSPPPTTTTGASSPRRPPRAPRRPCCRRSAAAPPVPERSRGGHTGGVLIGTVAPVMNRSLTLGLAAAASLAAAPHAVAAPIPNAQEAGRYLFDRSLVLQTPTLTGASR